MEGGEGEEEPTVLTLASDGEQGSGSAVPCCGCCGFWKFLLCCSMHWPTSNI